MEQLHLLLVTNPKEPLPPLLDGMPSYVNVTQGSTFDELRDAAAHADADF